MKCSIVIRCFNEEEHLPRLLEGIRQQTVSPSEIIVVDSGSTDATLKVARCGGARVVQIAQQEFSFGRSLNQGAEVAIGDLLVVVSAHTYPASSRWLEALLEPFTDPRVALVYGCQRGDHRTKFSEHQLLRQWFPDEPCLDQRHPFCNNANTAIRRSIWNRIPYDENLPGLEDIHWAKRALQAGYRLVYRPDAPIIHVHEENYGKIYHRYRREAMALRVVSPWERMRLSHSLSLMFNAMRSDWQEALRQGVFPRVFWSILCFRSAQYWGAYQGLRWRGEWTSDLRARLYYPVGYRASSSSVRAEHFPVEEQPVGVPAARADAD